MGWTDLSDRGFGILATNQARRAELAEQKLIKEKINRLGMESGYIDANADLNAQLFDGIVTGDDEHTHIRVDTSTAQKAQAQAVVGRSPEAIRDYQLHEVAAAASQQRRVMLDTKTAAIDATARDRGLPGINRGGGYDTPKVDTTGKVKTSHLAFGAFALETAATTLSMDADFASFGILGNGIVYSLAPLVVGAATSAIVVGVTYKAGRMIGDGRAGRNHAKAEGRDTGQGGELAGAMVVGFLALLLNAVSLGLRLSTDSGDENASVLLMVLAVVATLTTLAVMGMEAFSYQTTAGNSGTIINTRHEDANAVNAFRDAEQAVEATLPAQRQAINLQYLRTVQDQLRDLLSGAAKTGDPVKEKTVSERLAKVEGKIEELLAQDFAYEPFDLDAAANERYGTRHAGFAGGTNGAGQHRSSIPTLAGSNGR